MKASRILLSNSMPPSTLTSKAVTSAAKRISRPLKMAITNCF